MRCDCNGLGCPVDTTLGLIGGKYKALVLWHLLEGKRRYGALQRLIPQATPKMLTRHLRELEADGLLTREVFPVVPPRVEYALTEAGLSLRPLLLAMYDWGAGYMRARDLAITCSMSPADAPEA